MNELQINNYLTADSFTHQKFRGVLSYDELCCTNSEESGLYIVNLDVSTGPGSHWVCLYLEPGTSEYFDSLGNKPSKLEQFLLDRGCDYIYNSKKLQAENSDVCGDYCILFSFFRCRGFNFEEFLTLFSDDLILNDEMVKL